jgi:predicted HicB family RNase H-like nuclease
VVPLEVSFLCSYKLERTPLNRKQTGTLIDPMEYKGFKGLSHLEEESGSLHGHVARLRDVVTFQGDAFAELTQSFHDSVDEYLDFCESLGRSPEKPFSGQFMLRIDPALHRKLSVSAEAAGVSLNALVQTILERNTEMPANRRTAQHPGLQRIHRLKPKVAAQVASPRSPQSGKSAKRSGKGASKPSPK